VTPAIAFGEAPEFKETNRPRVAARDTTALNKAIDFLIALLLCVAYHTAITILKLCSRRR
jgi:hypothetical protein